ncbi:MAG: hypothetical protein GC152_06535 [Alphaproteobacteria bacterium]|nr:hypothetical protein [Alphaproteobacteria bacterium]
MSIFAIAACSPGVARADNACTTTGIETAASVTVSDGLTYDTQTFFRSRQHAIFRQIRSDRDSTVVVEGPTAWGVVDGDYRQGGNFEKLFALGHQIHALLVRFDDVHANVRKTRSITFNGNQRSARTGDYPYGGATHLIDGDSDRPAGFLFEFPETPPISATFHDWREIDDGRLPFRVVINDGDRSFDYLYTKLAIDVSMPAWAEEQSALAAFDATLIHRLHRRLLAAHCSGDAAAIASFAAPQSAIVANGAVRLQSPDDILQSFTEVFARLDYEVYEDVSTPIVRIADGGDIGWIAAQTRAAGREISTGRRFDDRWAWILPVSKVDGEWRFAGVAANRSE